MRGEEVAGAIYLGGAILSVVLVGEFLWAQIGLGIALLIPKERALSDLVRLIVFLWILLSVVIVIVGGFSAGYWYPIVPTMMVGVGVATLMMEGMEGRKTIAPACVAIAGAMGLAFA